MSVAKAQTCDSQPANRLNPAALTFVSTSSRSGSEAGSPLRSSSPESDTLRARNDQDSTTEMSQQHPDAAGPSGRGSGSGIIPAPAPQPPRFSLPRRSGSSNSLGSGCASPPQPSMPHPGMHPTYGWGAPIPVYHVYPGHEAGDPIDRAASPPSVFPAGGSPPLPTGFISVPLHHAHHHTLHHPGHHHPPTHSIPSEPGSPTARIMYSGSLPPYGASPPYGSSPPHFGGSPPPGMAGSPPGMMHYMQGPPPMMHGGEFGMAHAGYAMQHQQELMQRMSGMSLSQQQQQQPAAAMHRTSSSGSAGSGAGRSEGRASARIARSHRAGGAYNPAEFAFDLEEAESGRADARCTVMIRNCPNKYSQEMMLSILEKSGFSGTFDFFYLPIDFRNKCNLGYCFVNFLDASDAARLYRQFHNKRWEEYNSRKVCEVTYGRVQGRETLVEHFKASKFPSDDMDFMPLVYSRVEAGVASHPLAIHQYLGTSSGNGHGSDAAACGNGVAQGDEEAGSLAQPEASAVAAAAAAAVEVAAEE